MLGLWDTVFAEDPGLDLVDMVCVAMLLRIRWQCEYLSTELRLPTNYFPVIEANYSVALMLLLKYPSPEPPYGPQSFVDDAIYLRDNFSAAGGAKVISKYGARAPVLHSSDLRPSTPLGQGLSPKQKLSRTRSPLPSPATFLQQQGGVEALFQGAARGVLDRGERLGINQAVRDAVGEVRKNMQGLQASRSNSTRSRNSDAVRWSLDEGKTVPSSSRATVAVMNARNKQLARMLDQAMSDLRAVSLSDDGDKNQYIQAMDIAIAKVDFVKIYLEDSTMPLPRDSPQLDPASSSVGMPSPPPQEAVQVAAPAAPAVPTVLEVVADPSASTAPIPIIKQLKASPALPEAPSSPQSVSTTSGLPPTPITASTSRIQDMSTLKPTNESVLGTLARPKPMPTRSTIAQS